MIVREANADDYGQIRELHSSDGLAYALPNLENPAWIRRIVVEEGGEVVGAGLGLLSAETFLMLKQSSRMRMARRFVTIQNAAVEAARNCGLSTLHAWVAPAVERGFGEHLLRLGWSKPLWPAYEMVIRE